MPATVLRTASCLPGDSNHAEEIHGPGDIDFEPEIKWARPDSNRRPSLCESDVIPARPRARGSAQRPARYKSPSKNARLSSPARRAFITADRIGPVGGAVDGKGRKVRDDDNREEAARGPRLCARPLDDPGGGEPDRQSPGDRGRDAPDRRELRQRLED